jgi:membrane associated rhomboid family serine protease
MMNMTPVVKQLLIINIIFYIGSNFVGDYAYELFSMYYPESSHFHFWQPLTHMFMHAKYPMLSHIAFNMLGLVMFGSPLENFWGAKKFLFFYISCGLGAVLIQTGVNYYEIHSTLNSLSSIKFSSTELATLLNADYSKFTDIDGKISGSLNTILENHKVTQDQFNILSKAISNFQTPMVGASGAIYGLLVAFAFMFPNAELMLLFIPYPVKAKYFVPVLVALDLFSGVTGFSLFGGGIAHFAHVGGALVGFLMMWYWKNNKFKHNRWN